MMMQSQNSIADPQDFTFLDPDDYDHLRNDPNISTVLDDYASITQDKTLKIETIQNQYEDGLHYHNTLNFMSTMDMQIPSKEEYEGQYQFEVKLVTNPQGKHWVYSDVLKKVFIDIEKTLPLRFKWNSNSIDSLWLRTTMVFSHDQYRNEPVVRCHNHMACENGINLNINHQQLKHVVRCLNPNSAYEEKSGHLSVLTPLGIPQAGCDYVPLNFQFFCKNSCNSGMNRRPTELLFTLENRNFVVLGRRRLLVRVCSCPKRDKEKEEVEINKKLKGAKKRKLDKSDTKKLVNNIDTNVYKIALEIPGKENRNQILKYAYDLLAGESMRTNQQEFFKPFMDDILNKM